MAADLRIGSCQDNWRINVAFDAYGAVVGRICFLNGGRSERENKVIDCSSVVGLTCPVS